MKKSTFLLLALIAAASAPAGADELTVKGMPAYNNAKIVGCDDGQVTFQMAGNNNRVSKPVLDIDRLRVTGQDSFNDAEDKLAKGNSAEAVKAYDLAADRASDEWMKKLVTLRRLQALSQAGMIERATREWLVVLDQMAASKTAVAFTPGSFAAKGSPENDKAIALLEQRQAQEKSPLHMVAIKQLLVSLYEQQGRTDKVRQATPQTTTDKGPAVKTPVVTRAMSADESNRQIRALATLLGNKQPEKALASIQQNLQNYAMGDLASVFMLSAQSQMMLKDKAQGDERRKLLLGAGLDYMRAAAFFPSTSQAPEALYLAGVVHVELGNKPAATTAFKKVLSDYPDTEFGAKARAALDNLNQSEK